VSWIVSNLDNVMASIRRAEADVEKARDPGSVLMSRNQIASLELEISKLWIEVWRLEKDR
jgi:hypothetical protein